MKRMEENDTQNLKSDNGDGGDSLSGTTAFSGQYLYLGTLLSAGQVCRVQRSHPAAPCSES
jgi:hypothetical protein